MSTTSRRGLQWLCALAVVGAAVAGTACGSGSGSSGGFTETGDAGEEAGSSSGGLTDGGTDGNGGFGNAPTVTAIGIQPLTATITSNNGAKVTQAFNRMIRRASPAESS